MSTNGAHPQARELRVSQWVDAAGSPCPPLQMADFGPQYKIIFCFQFWCPGCHQSGFPSLQKLVRELSPFGFSFAAIQTVFEGEDQNTPDRLVEMQQRYNLAIPFGHDQIDGQAPTFMQDYQTRGTPWFVLISPTNDILFSDFHLDADKLIDGVTSQT